jgi:hypothetical protein
MITYRTNWMGPINLKWIKEHGDCWSAGRIDIRDSSKYGYDSWGEYAVAPMHSEDWRALSDFLDRLHGETILPYDTLIMLFEAEYGKKIRWETEPIIMDETNRQYKQ